MAHIPEKPTLVKVSEAPWTYRIYFVSGEQTELEADTLEWGSSFVRFYTEPDPFEKFLVAAYNCNTVEEIREIAKVDKEPALA